MLHIKFKRIMVAATRYQIFCQHIPSSDPGDGVKSQLFQNMVMLHIKLKRIRNAATWFQIFCPPPSRSPTLPPLGMRLIGKIQIFPNMVMLPIKLNGITKYSNVVANILTADPNPTPTLGSKFNFSEQGHVAIQIKWNHEI